jgi:hypothetical protein
MSLRSGFRVVLSATMYAWTRCPIRLYLQLLVEGPGFIYVSCVCLCMVVSNTCWLYIVIWRVSYVGWGCLPFPSAWVHTGVLVGSELLIALGFGVVCLVFLFVFVRCLACPVLPVFWIANSWLPIWFSLTFIKYVQAPRYLLWSKIDRQFRHCIGNIDNENVILEC